MLNIDEIFAEPELLPIVSLRPNRRQTTAIGEQANAAEARRSEAAVDLESEVVERINASNTHTEAVATRHPTEGRNCEMMRNDEPDLFADWILRPDLDGRLGWEPPDLPEAARWWSRIRF